MRKKNSRAIALVGAVLLIAPITAIGGVATGYVLWLVAYSIGDATTLSCADANAGWTGVTWSVWNDSSATGRGILRQNDCTPNCVSGKFINYRATVTLSKVVSTKKHGELFSVATFHYSVSGHAKTEVFDLVD